MTEQQITEFDRWFEQRMDPELNLTPGDKELCRHAWKAALSHAEWEAVGTLTIDRHGDEKFHALLPAIDLEPGTYEVYTHPAPAGEQPVSDPDGLPDRVLMPRALTAENGAKTALSDEFFVDFGVRCARCGNPDFSLDLGQCAACQHTECEPNRRAVSWTTIKRIYSRAVEFLGVPAPDEREIAALLERIVPRIDPQNPKPLDETEHCCECTLYYERERIHSEMARLRAGKEGE